MAERIAHALSDCAQTGEDDPGWDVSVSRGFGEWKADLRAWTALAWEASDALLFVGAAGIAVRAIAPHVASKASDSAVVAIDEAGRFAVPLLSGHLGGANELAQTVARAAGAIPVITTATDVRGVWAVDTWARCAGLAVSNPEAIKRVSARLLSGGRVALYSDMPISGQLPEGVDIASDRARADIVVSPFAGANAGASVRAAETTGEVVPAGETGKPAGVRGQAEGPQPPRPVGARHDEGRGVRAGQTPGVGGPAGERGTRGGVRALPSPPEPLRLVVPCIVAGIGCRRGACAEAIGETFLLACGQAGISPSAVREAATIDVKAHEEGLLAFCRARNIPLVTYSVEELSQVEGSVSPSDFVRATVGVDNVCERAALADGGKLIFPKLAHGGVTVAFSKVTIELSFKEL